MTEDEMVGWHHLLNRHEFEQAPGDSEEQGSLACCSPWDRKESDTTEQLNNNNNIWGLLSWTPIFLLLHTFLLPSLIHCRIFSSHRQAEDPQVYTVA